jgi:two-component system cell cycle sensor histidine kinase/response regulator CckA
MSGAGPKGSRGLGRGRPAQNAAKKGAPRPRPAAPGAFRLTDAAGGRVPLAAGELARCLFASSPTGIVAVDLTGTITACNDAFARILGVDSGEVPGRSLSSCLGRADRDDLMGQLSKLMMGTVSAIRLDGARVPTPGGGERFLSLSGVVARRDQQPAGVIIHVQDVTQHHTLEMEMAHAQKMQAVGQLAGGIAHDFNNLLTAILGFCDLLLGRHPDPDPSHEDVLQIRTNTQRASNLVRQLLAFSRKQVLRPVFLDVRAALEGLATMLDRLLGATIVLRLEHGPALAPIRVDPGQFDQVIINLAVNARDAMPGGGILTIRTAALVLAEEASRGGEVMPGGSYVIIDVTDTGVGIPDDIIANIFEPFFSTKEVGAGTGLGLATVYGIVHQTSGFIFVDSAPGEGTTFSIYFPSFPNAQAESKGEPASAAPVAIPLKPALLATLLLVEDEDPVRALASRALRSQGYRVLEATDGEAAIALANAHETIDLVVSDVVMPGMDGRMLVQLLRRERPGLPIILMSGYAEEEFGLDVGEGLTLFLAKPFTLAELTAKVSEGLGEPGRDD